MTQVCFLLRIEAARGLPFHCLIWITALNYPIQLQQPSLVDIIMRTLPFSIEHCTYYLKCKDEAHSWSLSSSLNDKEQKNNFKKHDDLQRIVSSVTFPILQYFLILFPGTSTYCSFQIGWLLPVWGCENKTTSKKHILRKILF